MADKNVKIQVDVDADDSKVKAIDEELNRLKQQRLQLKIDANKSELEETENRIKSLKIFLDNVNTGNTNIHIDDSEIEKAEKELEALESEKLNLQIAVATDELTNAKAQEEELNDTAHVDIDVDDAAVQGAMQNINDGINQAKQGLSELGQGVGDVLQSAGRMEQTETFLTMNLGADQAKKKLEEIRSVTDELPGDDVALQSLLSQSALKDTKLGAKEFTELGGAAADYMAAMQNFGKSSTETQQDLMNYILQGNTAEIERSPVLQSHIDKLKEGTSIQERSKLLSEALNEEGWKGISSQDTYNNKLQTFSDLLERGKMNLGGMFLDATKGAMGFIGDIDQATGGVVGMSVALASEFGPGLFSSAQGIVSMSSGLSTMAKQYGGIVPMIGSFGSSIAGAGSSLMTLATGPVGIAIAAIALLAIGIYEAGKAFGWWKDVGTMFEALKAGVLALWDAFISNPYVIQVIDLIRQGLTDAWNAIVGFGSAIMTALTGAGGNFDILSFMIQNLGMVLNAVGPLVVLAIQGIIQHFRNLYTAGQIVWPYISSAISTAMGIATGIVNAGKGVFQSLAGVWNGLSSTVSSMASTISGALSSAGSAWNSFKTTVMNAVQPILDAASQVGDAIGQIGSAIGLGGIETPTVGGGGYYGATTVTQGNTIIFNMYGDIRDEKTLDETIDAINNRIQFDALANGSLNDNGGAI